MIASCSAARTAGKSDSSAIASETSIVKAKTAGHATTTRLNCFNLEIWHELEHALDIAHPSEGFLVAMAVQQCAAWRRLEGQV